MGFFDSLGDLFGLGDDTPTPGSSDTGFNLSDLIGPALQVGGGLLGQYYQNKYTQEASDKAMADKLKLMEAELEIKKKYGLLGGGGGGGGSGAAMYAAQTQRAATLAQLYQEMAKQRLLGSQGVQQAYGNMTGAVQGPLLARAR